MSGEEKQSVESQPYFWKYTAIVALIFGSPALVFTSMQIYDWLTKASGPEFVVAADYVNFGMPPQLTEAITELDSTKLDERGVLSLDPKGSLQRQCENLHGYLTLTVRNSGDLSATKVRVQTKTEGFAIVEWDDGETEQIAFTNDIDIGTLDIEKTVTVSAWTKDRPATQSPPLVVHGNGSFPVCFDEPTFIHPADFEAILFAILCIGVLGTLCSLMWSVLTTLVLRQVRGLSRAAEERL